MGVAYDAFGGAAHEDMLQSGVAVGGDNNEIDIEFFRGESDFVEGAAFSHDGFLHERRSIGGFLYKPVQAGPRFLDNGFHIEHQWKRTGKIGSADWFDDAEENQFRTKLSGELHG